MQHRRVLIIAMAILFGVTAIATGPHHASVNILVANGDDPAPHRLDARIELDGIAFSLLVRWSGHKSLR